nr:hypothetical protein [Dechloromonas sp.]
MGDVKLWTVRDRSWEYLSESYPSRVEVVLRSFELIDSYIDHYEKGAGSSVYANVCGLTLLKGKNLALGALSLILDALGQEAGALLRPLIEYIELLTYFRKYPEETSKVLENNLPSAGRRAKAIEGIYRNLREHLNENAAHSAFSDYSISHLLTPEFSFRKFQEFHPHVLEKNFRDYAVQLQFLLQEGLFALEHIPEVPIGSLALEAEAFRIEMLHVFDLHRD